MSDNPGAWYHCTRCGTLFKAGGTPEERGDCPSCGGDPAGQEEPEAAGLVRVRRKVRKPKAATAKRRHRHGRRKARALMIFVIAWGTILGVAAVWTKRRWSDAAPSATAEDPRAMGGQAMEDQRLIQDQLEACGNRLEEFLAASDISGRSPHVLRAERALPRMVRFQQDNPIFPSTLPLAIESYKVLHTPAGRVIETLWKQGGDQFVEAVFAEEAGEWKIDWDAFVRMRTEPWALFLAGQGEGAGEFRVLARERIGANGRDAQYIGLVLYTSRPGHPDEAVSPSPEVKVERDSPMGRQIEEAFVARMKGFGPYGSQLVRHDPDEMVRLRVRMSRHGEAEREFQITELIACHWMELEPAPANEEPSGP